LASHHPWRPSRSLWTSRGGAPGLGDHPGRLEHQGKPPIKPIDSFLFASIHQITRPCARLHPQSTATTLRLASR
jgi:hypothetical protein